MRGNAAQSSTFIPTKNQIPIRFEMPGKVVLVACCGAKRTSPALAKDLYVSALFRKARRYAERAGGQWFILSAKHGVVHPDSILDPYDETLSTKSKNSRRQWAQLVAEQLSPMKADTFVVLAGEKYCTWTDGFNIERPMRGMSIGKQLQFLYNLEAALQRPALL